MTPIMLRQLWSLIETTQATLLVNLDDATLVQWLLKQLKMNSALNGKEADLLNEYIQSRLSLIRDLAEQRLAPSRLSHSIKFHKYTGKDESPTVGKKHRRSQYTCQGAEG